MPAPSRRRWFRFSLRGLLIVVTLASIWLGWQVKIVRDRKEALRAANVHGDVVLITPLAHQQLRVSWIRRTIGDQAVGMLELGKDTPLIVIERLKSAYPEAHVYRSMNSYVDLLGTHKKSVADRVKFVESKGGKLQIITNQDRRSAPHY